MELIEKGIERGLIRFDEDRNFITYIHQNKKRNYNNPEDIKHLPIPVPPIEKQQEIANHTSDIRKKAQDLKDKTKELLEEASKEIEKLLIA